MGDARTNGRGRGDHLGTPTTPGETGCLAEALAGGLEPGEIPEKGGKSPASAIDSPVSGKTLGEALASSEGSGGSSEPGAESSIEWAVGWVLSARLRAIGRAAARVRESGGRTARPVHKLRVATRRAEAALVAFEPWVPGELSDRVRAALSMVRRPAGRVRDGDVQGSVFALVRERASAGRRRAASYMLVRTRKRQDRWRERLLDAIGERPRRVWRELRREVEAHFASPREVETDRPMVRYVDAARASLDRMLSSAMSRAGADLRDAEALHEFRLASKALRYGLEAYRPCLEPGLSRRLDAAMRALQDRLGLVQDAAALAERVERERVRLLERDERARTAARLGALAARADRVRAQRLDAFLRWWGARGSLAALGALRHALDEPTDLPAHAEMRGRSPAHAAPALISAHERIAAIDIGSNTVRLVAAELWPDRRYRILRERRLTPRLGEGLGSTGQLTEHAIERTIEAVADLAGEARRLGVTRLLTVATAATRDAANGAEFLDRVGERAGVEVRVLDPEEEGRLAYLSAAGAFGLGVEAATVIDLGGGSAELAAVRRGSLSWVRSAPIGAVRLTERFGGGERVRTEGYAALREHVEAAVVGLVEGLPVPIDATVGSGGTFTMVAKIVRGLRGEAWASDGAAPVHGMPLHLDEVSRVLELLRETPVAERGSIRGLSASRAEIALAGVVVIERTLAALGASRVIVNARGMRDGLLLAMMGWSPGVEGSPPMALAGS